VLSSMYDGIGRPVLLGRELGKGGEGYVREVAGRPSLVAKVYHQAQPPLKLEKLGLLPSLATNDLLSVSAWPTGTLSDTPGGTLRGILLPRVTGQEIHFVYSPAQRRQHFPKSDWSFLVHIAMNVAAAVETVHTGGYVIGDLNQSGFFVSDDGMVRLIDCDSFQLKYHGKIYRCDVRSPHYMPPELQSANLSAIDATVEHDSFGLGILIFHLLFMGRHPFAGRYLGSGDMPIEKAIGEKRFAFSAARSSYQMDVPPYAPTLELIPPAFGNLFERAFRGDPLKRPQSAEWYGALRSLKSSLQKCRAEQSHVYSSHLRDCPWCELEHIGVPSFFILAAVTFDFDGGFDLAAIWREVERLASVPDCNDFLATLSPTAARPIDLNDDAKYRALGPVEELPSMPLLALLTSPELPMFHPPPPSGDPRSGYVPQEEPPLPEFSPETLPPERTLELLPLPEAPKFQRVDYSAASRQRYDKLRRYWEYRTVKWSTSASILCAALLHFQGSELPAVLVALVGAASGFAWFVIGVKYRRELSRNLRVAKAAQDKADAKMADIRSAYETRRARVEEANRQRREEHARYLIEMEHSRAMLPVVNEEKRRRWLEQCQSVERQREAVRERNRSQLRQWAARMQEKEAQLRRQWEIEVVKVQEERQAIDQENQRRRQAWEALLPQHNAMVRAIADMNRRRNEARQRCDQELHRRAADATAAEQKLRQILDRWDAEQSRYNLELALIRNDVAGMRRKYEQLKVAFERERDQLMSGFRQAQLDDFLRQQVIDSDSIPGIREKRKVILSAFGIETAFDITNQGMAAVNGQGFGPKLLNALYQWRQRCERSFVFNSQKQITSPALRNLQMKYQPERTALQNGLRAGLKSGKDLVAAAAQRQQQLHPEANSFLAGVMQAKASLALAQEYSR
jgi:DNA-binding helix-hairpin-helix protein with protein kinase domain